jgi:hypothetical protein
MADLNQAYGGLDNNLYSQNEYLEEQEEIQQPVVKEPVYQKPKASPPVQHIQQPPVQHFTMPQPEFPQQSQGSQGSHGHVAKRNPSYSFSDRMAMKRGEVIKLAMFSLVIVLAISLERIGTHYLTKYLSDNLFTEFQEFMLRLSYPVIVFILLWIIKSI